MLNVSVIVTVKNELKTIHRLLAALATQLQLPDEVVIVDAFSNDGTWEWLQTQLKKMPFPIKILQQKGNRSQGRNAAIQHARHAVVAVTDAGCVPDEAWLLELSRRYQQAKKTSKLEVVVAGMTMGLPQSNFEIAMIPYVLVMPDQVKEESYLPATRSMLLEKKTWRRVGRFNERLDQAEDYAFARELANDSHVKIVTAHQATVGWWPRSSLASFAQMIYHYAWGDAFGTAFRIKVLSIPARYLAAGILALIIARYQLILGVLTGLGLMFGYIGWSIRKNKRYVSSGWWWLPVLQVVSDGAVAWGTTRGLLAKLYQKVSYNY